MTDNEIIQALESEIHIAEYVDNDFADNVSVNLLKDTLDLINRQQAEIDEMKETRVKNFETWKLLDRKTKQFYAERYEEAKEIVKAEAIKEFAEKVKSKVIVDLFCGVDSADYLDDILFKNIDNLVKEMVGENNGSL